ncbi:hypothetical protein FRC02_002891 [Tulasnella sp. 418]|nr:hypothetical protein FRC02_002891 [Tulasnella sp. 418]
MPQQGYTLWTNEELRSTMKCGVQTGGGSYRISYRATIAPVIIALDKTRLLNFSWDKTANPVYITIGNLSKNLC